MKFTDYFILEANKKEKSSVEEDDNFLLGAELEFCMKDMINSYNVAQFIKSKTNIKFNHSDDTSIDTSSHKDSSIEIQTIPKPWKEFQEEIQEFLELIQKYGYTNDSCGMHVTISYQDKELPSNFGQKMHLSMQDPKAHKYFPSRKDNFYTKSRSEKDTDYHSKYYSFRIRKGTNQVEFRIIGGKDYEYKWNEIRNLILDYMVKYKNSLLDPEFMKKKRLTGRVKAIQDPKSAYKYALDVIKGRFPEAEQYIAKDPDHAYLYARNIIKGRFPEAEPNIVKTKGVSHLYAKNIIKGRWLEAEKYIIEDLEHAYLYARDIIRDRWLEAEPNIAKDINYAYRYAVNIIKGRFIRAEPNIAKDINYAYRYAVEIIKGRFIRAEPNIAKDPECAYRYARDLIKGRFPEAEPYILSDNRYSYLYALDVIKGRWPEAEHNIMKDPIYSNYYKQYVIKDSQ